MTPEEYEHHVAEVLRAEGWSASVTPYTHDFGVDVIAERDGRRLAVQAKMFGGANRPVAATMVRELYGAAAYADCSEAMIFTDGRVLEEAREVAAKLGIEIRSLPAVGAVNASVPSPRAGDDEELSFGEVWRDYVMPMVGRTFTRSNGKTNTVLAVDNSCLERRTSTGRRQLINVEIFRWAIEKLLDGATVSRDDINARYPGRASSGIALILSYIPLFESTRIDGKECLRMRPKP